MALVSCNLISDGESTHDVTGKQFREVWRVILDDTDTRKPQAARLALLSQEGIQYGTAYGGDANATATRVTSRYEHGAGESGRQHLLVTVDYAYPSATTPQDDPLDDPAIIHYGNQAYEEIVYRDINGDAILNSAGDPFDPPLTRTRHYQTITIQRNESSFDDSVASAFIDRVNDSDALVNGRWYDAYTLLCTDLDGANAQRNGSEFYVVTYALVIAHDGEDWERTVLDLGLREWKDSGDHTKGLKAILVDGIPTSVPVRLNGSGVYVGDNSGAGASAYGDFAINALADFWTLGLASP